MAQKSALQEKTDLMLAGRNPLPATAKLTAAPVMLFSTFVPEHLERALDLCTRLIEIAEENAGEEGLVAALEAAERESADEELKGMAQHAVKLFLTHYPPARDALELPLLELRQPDLVRPSVAAPAALRELAPEQPLAFWREDPLFNTHHEHWHLVYPYAGRPAPRNEPRQLGDRQGELFAYMHQQMLARYDAERLALGLGRVTPMSDYHAAIPEGYDPGELKLRTGTDNNGKPQWQALRARPNGAKISDLAPPFDKRPGALVSSMEGFREEFLSAVRRGWFTPPGKEPVRVTADTYGHTEEATIGTVDPPPNKKYGNHHNDGHIHLMYFDNQMPFGVMGYEATAIRDPVFYRWHKHIDDLYDAYRKTQPPNDFRDAPPVVLAGMGLLRRDGLPSELQPKESSACQEVVSGTLTDEDAAQDLGAATPVRLAEGVELTPTHELLTEMRRRKIELRDDNDKPVIVWIDYLSHDDFSYVFFLANQSSQPQLVTLRVFIAPEEYVEDRNAWIEMDRFQHRLQGAGAGWVLRHAEQSSVVRKPALKPEDLEGGAQPPGKAAWCDGGWPYTTLLPRGTKEGMKFRLFAMCSPGTDLEPPANPNSCTSLSYCGLKDKKYPDRRSMGYPFDREFPRGIERTIREQRTMASLPFLIRCKNLAG